MNSVSSSNFFLRPWCTSTPFYPKRAIYSVHLNDASVGDFLKRSNFFTDETKKVVLTCLRLETRSNIYYFWNFIMHSISSSNFVLRPWCSSTPFYPKRARYSVHLSDSSMGDFLKRNIFFTDETKKVVLTCLRLETRSNIYYFWNSIMHSITSSNFVLRPWCSSTPFYTKRARNSVHLSYSSRGIFKEKQFFHRWDQNNGFHLSTLRNTFHYSLHLKFNHALIIFIKFLFAALLHVYSALLQEGKIFCSSQWFICGDLLRRKNFFADETKKVVLTCLRLETRSNIHYFWSSTMHSLSSSNFFLPPWCRCTPF